MVFGLGRKKKKRNLEKKEFKEEPKKPVLKAYLLQEQFSQKIQWYWFQLFVDEKDGESVFSEETIDNERLSRENLEKAFEEKLFVVLESKNSMWWYPFHLDGRKHFSVSFLHWIGSWKSSFDPENPVTFLSYFSEVMDDVEKNKTPKEKEPIDIDIKPSC